MPNLSIQGQRPRRSQVGNRSAQQSGRSRDEAHDVGDDSVLETAHTVGERHPREQLPTPQSIRPSTQNRVPGLVAGEAHEAVSRSWALAAPLGLGGGC